MAVLNPDPEAYRLAYELGRAAVADQGSVLKDLRDRSGALMAAAAAIATLALGLANRDNRIDLLWWGAIGLLVGASGLVLCVVSTVQTWRPVKVTVNMNAGTVVGSFVERPDDPMSSPEMHRELALWLGQFTIANRDALEVRLKWFSAGLVGLGVETGGLMAMLLDVATG